MQRFEWQGASSKEFYNLYIIYIHFLERCNIPCLRYAYDRFEPVSERFLLEGEKKKAVGMLSFAIVLWMLIVGIDVQLTPHLDDT